MNAALTERLYHDLRASLFTPRTPGGPPLVGAELEVIPVWADSHRRVPTLGRSRSAMAILRTLADRLGWRERMSDKGTPLFHIDGGSRVTFEPGGQVEISVAPHQSVSGVMRELERLFGVVERHLQAHGVDLLTLGIDPYNPIDTVPLQFDCDRYRRMTAYFDQIGPAGARMMRQTATLHVNLDLGERPVERWRILNGLVPPLVAMFANSRRYEQQDSGYASYRAEAWRTLDWSRTGLVSRGGDPVGEYLDFALSSNAILLDPSDGEYTSFGSLWQDGLVDMADWQAHLTTLFPEVRPRGYYEFRALDAVPLRWVAAPLAVLVGLTHDPISQDQAREVVGPGRTALLHIAGAKGLGDSRLASQAVQLADIALAGCRRLGREIVAEADIETAELFFDRYTRRGRTLNDDASPSTASLVAEATR